MDRQIKSYFVISCKDSNRFNRFDNLDFVNVVPAIDSRIDPIKSCQENNFQIDLLPEFVYHYKKCIGAFGCFMSHHLLWEKIASFDDDFFYCILEDDVRIGHINKFYELDYSPNKPLVNLNYRLNNGSDAYVINKEMAKLLLTECNRTLTHSVDKFLFEYIVQKYPMMFEQDSHIDIDHRFKKPRNRDILKRK